MSFLKSFAGDVLGGVVGGLFGNYQQKKANKSQAAVNRENIAFQRESQDKSEALQREFAQHGLRWKAEDAKAAGLHPLSALGAQGASYSPPVTVGSSQAPEQVGHIARMGQDIGRAVSAAMDPHERASRQLDLRLKQAAESKDLAQASYYNSLAARERLSPAIPIPLGDSVDRTDWTEIVPSEIVSKMSDQGHIQAGHPAAFMDAEFAPGMYIRLPVSDDMSEAMGFEGIPGVTLGGYSGLVEYAKQLYDRNALGREVEYLKFKRDYNRRNQQED